MSSSQIKRPNQGHPPCRQAHVQQVLQGLVHLQPRAAACRVVAVRDCLRAQIMVVVLRPSSPLRSLPLPWLAKAQNPHFLASFRTRHVVQSAGPPHVRPNPVCIAQRYLFPDRRLESVRFYALPSGWVDMCCDLYTRPRIALRVGANSS